MADQASAATPDRTRGHAAAAPAAEPAPGGVETPSGKGAGDENFPVGSALIARELRPTVARCYAFARGADDIADNPALSPEDKVRRLDAFEAGLDDPTVGPVSAHRLAEALRRRGLTDRHARDLLSAFRQDAVKRRYANWAELLDYCERSANPVGRFLLDLHDESRVEAWPASDALCTVLQILNHLQDLKDDLVTIDRCYVPQDWLAEAGLDVSALTAAEASPALRGVIDRMLDGCDALIAEMAPLPMRLKSRRMAAESAVICALARRLAAKLRRQDPIAERVKLGKLDFAAALLSGAGGALISGGPAAARARARAAARAAAEGAALEDLLPEPQDLDARYAAEAVVSHARTSFAAGMRILSKPRRDGMFAIYAFCRRVDDIADGDFAPAAKRAALAAWRDEIAAVYAGRPRSPVGRALIEPVHRFQLPQDEFLLMIDGMEMDAEGPIVAPDWARLRVYTRRVAGSVGMLSMRVFGAWVDGPGGAEGPSERFALALADALQLTNILRDVEEDARIGRLYLPREALAREGVAWNPLDRLADPDAAAPAEAEAMRRVCREVGEIARERFAAARREIPAHRRRALTPALLMLGPYERYLDLIEARDWRRAAEPVRLSGKQKLWHGLICVLAPGAGIGR